MAKVHSIWGRHIAEYSDSYTYKALMQQLHSKMVAAAKNANVFIMNKGMEGIRKISDIANEEDENKMKSMARGVTLETLQDVLDMTWGKLSLSFLTEPQLAQGCIKLMTTVIPDGQKTASPFSYEYGYICFRIATISLDLCLTEPLLDSAFKTAAADLRAGRIHPFHIVTETVANYVKSNVQSSPTLKNKKMINETALVVPSRDASRLLNTLWEDRYFFFRATLHTYTPGTIGSMYLLWQLWRIGRQTSGDGDLRRGVPLYELLRRYSLGGTRDQDLTLSMLLSDTQFLGDLWQAQCQLLGAEDSQAIIYGYAHRITTSNTWYCKPDICLLPPILHFVVRFAQPGAEDVFPSLFAATIRFLWDQIECKDQIDRDDIENIVQIFHYFTKIIEIMSDTSRGGRYAMQILVQELVSSDLVGFIARLIVLRRPTTDKSDHERGM
ncbi:hypothetical protein FRC11_006023 [Ceratobasidium sp. 423]|nr:hypothetical protein FRC11_006023 [Ceratobasidium sp. 423]